MVMIGVEVDELCLDSRDSSRVGLGVRGLSRGDAVGLRVDSAGDDGSRSAGLNSGDDGRLVSAGLRPETLSVS